MADNIPEVRFDDSKPPSKRSYGYRGLRRVLREGLSTVLRKTLFLVLRSKTRPAYEQLGDGDRISVIWEEQGLNLACCDCGLVHYINFLVVDGVIIMRFWRNEEETDKHRKTKFGENYARNGG